jgi:hypothetical protein
LWRSRNYICNKDPVTSISILSKWWHLCFLDRVSLCSPGWPQSSCSSLLSAGITDMHHHIWLQLKGFKTTFASLYLLHHFWEHSFILLSYQPLLW